MLRVTILNVGIQYKSFGGSFREITNKQRFLLDSSFRFLERLRAPPHSAGSSPGV